MIDVDENMERGTDMNISGIVGFIGFWVLIGAAIALGGNPLIFVNVPSIIIVAGVVSCTGLMAFGMKDLLDGVLGLRALVVRVPDEALQEQQAQVLRGLIPSSYAAGGLGTLIGGVQMLAAFDDPSQIGPGMAVAILTVLYSILLAEGVLRPGARHIEHRSSLHAGG